MSVKVDKKRLSARQLALTALDQIETHQAFADLTLNSLISRQSYLDPRERSLATQITYGTLRWRLTLDYILLALSCRKKIKANITLQNILRMSFYQLIFLDRVPPNAVVNEAVNLTKQIGQAGKAGFVNAILRNFIRYQGHIKWPQPEESLIRAASVLFSFPEWLIERWLKFFSLSELCFILNHQNLKKPRTARVNLSRHSVPDILQLLNGSTGLKYSPSGVKIMNNSPEVELQQQKGSIYFQDEGSQLIPLLLDVKPGGIYLDACAAPGGKTLLMADLLEGDGDIFAVDIYPHRVNQITENANHLQSQGITPICGDFTKEIPALQNIDFDGILVDAPCSGSGTFSRNPDLKWRLSPEDFSGLTQLQSKLLERAARLTSVGKPIVYSVCSIDPSEGKNQIDKFLQRNPNFEIDKISSYLPSAAHSFINKDGSFSTIKCLDEMDGFFAARLLRCR